MIKHGGTAKDFIEAAKRIARALPTMKEFEENLRKFVEMYKKPQKIDKQSKDLTL